MVAKYQSVVLILALLLGSLLLLAASLTLLFAAISWYWVGGHPNTPLYQQSYYMYWVLFSLYLSGLTFVGFVACVVFAFVKSNAAKRLRESQRRHLCKCGYDLRDLPGSVKCCPECGRERTDEAASLST